MKGIDEKINYITTLFFLVLLYLFVNKVLLTIFPIEFIQPSVRISKKCLLHIRKV